MNNHRPTSRLTLALLTGTCLLFASCDRTADEVAPMVETSQADATTASSITLKVPSTSEVGKAATFSGTCSNVYKYIASADGYVLKEEVIDGKTKWSFKYTFNTAGNYRNLHINGFDRLGNIVATDHEGFYVAPKGQGNAAVSLQQMILRRCEGIGPKNRPYEFNGIGDCWGFVRQVWNAVLSDGREHTEDYGSGYNKGRWVLAGSKYLPVNDASSSNKNWVKVTNFNDLPIGVPLSSHQGHAWGDTWHGAIYAGKANGKHMMWDCSGRSSRNGAYYRAISESPKISNGYYYVPLYKRLKGK